MLDSPKKIDELGKLLDEASEALNKELDLTEHSLAALALGIHAEVPLHEESAGKYIGYGKQGKNWVLYYRSEALDRKTRLTAAGRSIRVQAANRLEALLGKMLTDREAHLTQVKEAVLKTKAFNEKVWSLVEEDSPPSSEASPR